MRAALLCELRIEALRGRLRVAGRVVRGERLGTRGPGAGPLFAFGFFPGLVFRSVFFGRFRLGRRVARSAPFLRLLL
jgi:hypothetical protein